MMNIHKYKSVGPYTWVTKDQERGRYRVLIYGAYNAMGLIGSEHNGICVLDNKTMKVVTDKISKSDSGYFGPTLEQRNCHSFLMNCTPEEFCSVINTSGRNRIEIRPETVPQA